MKRVLLVVVLALASAYAWWTSGTSPSLSASSPGVSAPASASSGDGTIAAAFEAHRRGVQVQGRGVVDKLLRDDHKGEPHQRFIVRLGSGQSVMIAHNLDEAPRIDSLRSGDTVEFNGVY